MQSNGIRSNHGPAFDYIVVGAGSAGCVLAGRLSEDPHISVLLLEAGGRDDSPLIHAPGGLLPIMIQGRYAWRYQTVPQKHMNDRVLYSPRGKVLGGSSSINGMVYDRGAPSDYDTWRQLGNEGWSYADLLPYFRRAETYEPGADEYHGGEGPVRVSRPGANHALSKAWIEAGLQAGYPYNDDTNGAAREGFGPVDLTISRGRRWSAATAYLRPARSRPNLTIATGALAGRVLFEGSRAVGVEYRQDGQTRQAHADREVILSGGAIASPQLLMLSGVGDGDDLREHGIATVADLKGVGRNLQDHLAGSVKYASVTPISLYRHMSPLPAAAAFGRYLLFRTGPLASTGIEAVAFVKSRSEVPGAEIKFHFVMALYQNNGREFIRRHGFYAHTNCIRPESRGSITLQSADPAAPPVIDPNFLAVDNDRRVLREGLKIAREVFGQKAFDPYRGEEIAPGREVRTDAEIDAYIRAKAEADYHSAGTCKMGQDEMAVVDDRLRVHGLEGLRVVDASIMPLLIGGNTNMPTIMIAEKASDMILGKPALPRAELN